MRISNPERKKFQISDPTIKEDTFVGLKSLIQIIDEGFLIK